MFLHYTFVIIAGDSLSWEEQQSFICNQDSQERGKNYLLPFIAIYCHLLSFIAIIVIYVKSKFSKKRGKNSHSFLHLSFFSFALFALDVGNIYIPQASLKLSLISSIAHMCKQWGNNKDNFCAGDYQEGWGGAHDDRESGSSEHQTSFSHSKFSQLFPWSFHTVFTRNQTPFWSSY